MFLSTQSPNLLVAEPFLFSLNFERAVFFSQPLNATAPSKSIRPFRGQGFLPRSSNPVFTFFPLRSQRLCVKLSSPKLLNS